ncbi:MAG: glycoside hydrolase family 2 [Bacteroidia bacterium]|nr:MAG: glycoside hydrolase family 2 [Bacteroidia bacterium]
MTSAILCFGIICPCTAQILPRNFGLTQPQDPTTLPVSRSGYQTSERKAKSNVPCSFQRINENEYVISSGWEMAEAEKVTSAEHTVHSNELTTSDWYNATVPGTVLTTLVEQGVYPDPYFGLNNLYIPDSLCRKDWWYRLNFNLPDSGSGKITWLLFNGINYRADIWLNGKMLGQMTGAFRRGVFNATDHVKNGGNNILAVHIRPPNNPGIPHEESLMTGAGPNGGQLCLDGPTFIASEGWDWVPGIRDRNIGIWQDVRIRFTDAVTIEDPQVITDLPLPDTTSALLTVKTGIRNNSGKVQNITIIIALEEIELSKTVALNPGELKQVIFSPSELPGLNLMNPRLWWPNGYGNAELYQLHLKVIMPQGNLSDQKSLRFGIREYSYELSVALGDSTTRRIQYNPVKASGIIMFDNIARFDAGDGTVLPTLAASADTTLFTAVENNSSDPFLRIMVNGIPVFCRGGNWGMDDAMKQVSAEKLEPCFRLHRDANFNMIRNWTGESTEEVFFDLCDEYGMMVWNDFWLSTEGYNLNVNDNRLFMDNAEDVVKRFRNHPSIAIWCPRNEGYAPPELETELQKLIAREDGTRMYQPNSRHLNLRPSGPWHFYRDPSHYVRDVAGFNTEIGIPSVPTASSMRKMMTEEDLWPVSDVWAYHDFHNGQESYCAAIADLYDESSGVDDFCKKAQLVNYESHRAMFEAWNSRLWNNVSGVLLWMSHPAWPSTDWQIYSWDYETIGSYFGSKKACEPLHIQMTLHDRKVSVVNTTLLRHERLKAEYQIFDITGRMISHHSSSIDAIANAVTHCFDIKLQPTFPDVFLIRLTLISGKKVVSQNDYWQSSLKERKFVVFNTLDEGKLSASKLSGDEERVRIMIINRGKDPVIGVKLNLRDKDSGEILLPAYFSEGYFNLLPGERRIIEVQTEPQGRRPCTISAEGYNLHKAELLVL